MIQQIGTRFLLSLALLFSLVAGAMGNTDCDYRGIGQALASNQREKALSMSVACEDALRKQSSGTLAEPMLRAQYLATAQILIALGRYADARARMTRAEGAESFLVPLHELEQSTKGFLLERSVSTNEAILYYRPRPQAYALERLALIYLDSNQATAAGDAAAAALKIAPNSPTALIVLAALVEKTDPAQAVALYKKAIESASAGNPSISAFRYLELPRAYAGIARLEPKR